MRRGQMTVEALAKVNFTLEVFGKRPDGFHALRSVVVPIGLSDTLTFSPAGVFATDTGYQDDLILKAAAVLRAQAERENALAGGDDALPCYSVRVEKRIPAGGGLGGGSADAAATLLALNELWGLGKTPEELSVIGAGVGSDVPALVLACRYRVPVLMQGRGEDVALLTSAAHRAAGGGGFALVLANPGVPSSTAAVYGKCVPRVTGGDDILYTMRTALESGDMARIAAAAMNDLQEPAVALCPAIGEALRALRAAGALGTTMSGSGSTVFGFVPTEGEGRKIATLLNDRGMRAWSVAVCPVV